MAKTLYHMMAAPSAEHILSDALGAHPWTWPLNFMIGSGISGSVTTMQLISLPSGRVPLRYQEYPVQSATFFLNYCFGDTDVQESPDADWIVDTVLNQMFHPLNHFPIVRAHAQDPVIKFMANANNTPQWVFGRKTPFPRKGVGEEDYATGYRVDPRYSFQFNSNPPYQKNPLFSGWADYTGRWLTQTHQQGGVSPSIHLS